MSIWIPLVAAVLGAFAAGAAQLIFRISDRRRKSRSMITAVASEIKALTDLIRLQGYRPVIANILDECKKGNSENFVLRIEIRSEYFTIFEGLGSDIGYIEPDQCHCIVQFYSKCRSFIDCTRPDSVITGKLENDDAIRHYATALQLIDDILFLGDKIAQYPNPPLSSLTCND